MLKETLTMSDYINSVLSYNTVLYRFRSYRYLPKSFKYSASSDYWFTHSMKEMLTAMSDDLLWAVALLIRK